jgi:hypothetical protein
VLLLALSSLQCCNQMANKFGKCKCFIPVAYIADLVTVLFRYLQLWVIGNWYCYYKMTVLCLWEPEVNSGGHSINCYNKLLWTLKIYSLNQKFITMKIMEGM